jgi:cob(I)alamin adenosyltransferase
MDGYIQVYTGNGKGKTTAALGLALRASGWGFKTYVAQFLKGRPDDEDMTRARAGLEKALEAMLSGDYRIVVLDEVNTAVHFKILPEQEVLDFLDKRPAGVEVILTGRYAPDSFIVRADLVTEMTAVKHYYDRGVKAREGIEK